MLSPWALRADLRRRPWGGDRLAARWAPGEVDVEDGRGPVGEAWLAGPWTRVAVGPDAGRDLAALAAEHGAALLGAAPWSRYGARFPLLVKLLDAAEPLSLQVHPDDAYALRFEAASGHLGKTEAWWVLSADPGARVIWGFARDVTQGEVERAAESGHWGDLLRELPVAAGDVVVNPAGTVHALGAGLIVYEVQQASDLTYRLYDHGRVGADGRPRELHLERALAVARLTPGPAPAPTPVARASGRVELARTDVFVLEAVDPRAEGAGASGVTWEVGTGSFELLTDLGDAGTSGVGTLRWAGGEARVTANSSWLLPAGLGPVALQGPSRCARCWVPGPLGVPRHPA
jgi:mannose-6-phosphate isomerase